MKLNRRVRTALAAALAVTTVVLLGATSAEAAPIWKAKGLDPIQ